MRYLLFSVLASVLSVKATQLAVPRCVEGSLASAQVDNATERLTAKYVDGKEVDIGRGGEPSTQDLCRKIMAVELMGEDKRSAGDRCLRVVITLTLTCAQLLRKLTGVPVWCPWLRCTLTEGMLPCRHLGNCTPGHQADGRAAAAGSCI